MFFPPLDHRAQSSRHRLLPLSPKFITTSTQSSNICWVTIKDNYVKLKINHYISGTGVNIHPQGATHQQYLQGNKVNVSILLFVNHHAILKAVKICSIFLKDQHSPLSVSDKHPGENVSFLKITYLLHFHIPQILKGKKTEWEKSKCFCCIKSSLHTIHPIFF